MATPSASPSVASSAACSPQKPRARRSSSRARGSLTNSAKKARTDCAMLRATSRHTAHVLSVLEEAERESGEGALTRGPISAGPSGSNAVKISWRVASEERSCSDDFALTNHLLPLLTKAGNRSLRLDSDAPIFEGRIGRALLPRGRLPVGGFLRLAFGGRIRAWRFRRGRRGRLQRKVLPPDLRRRVSGLRIAWGCLRSACFGRGRVRIRGADRWWRDRSASSRQGRALRHGAFGRALRIVQNGRHLGGRQPRDLSRLRGHLQGAYAMPELRQLRTMVLQGHIHGVQLARIGLYLPMHGAESLFGQPAGFRLKITLLDLYLPFQAGDHGFALASGLL